MASYDMASNICRALAKGRDKQMSRISREERLSELRCQLSGKDGAAGKVVGSHGSVRCRSPDTA
jgi:hypothetical protein